MSTENPVYKLTPTETEDPICPWDHLEKEEDEFWKNFIAWEKWMTVKYDAILDSITRGHKLRIYLAMVELVETSRN